MHHSNVRFVVAIVASLLMGALVMLIPAPASYQAHVAEFHWMLALMAIAAALQVGAAVMFLSSLGVYKGGLRRAYVEIAIGVVLMAVASVQIPLTNAFNLWQTAWVQLGGSVMLYFLSGAMLYVGIRSFARLINVRSRLLQYKIILPPLVVFFGLSILVPAPAAANGQANFGGGFSAAFLWNAVLNLIAAIVMIRVTRTIGQHYTRAMAWLTVAMFCAAGTVITVPLFQFIIFQNTGSIGMVFSSVVVGTFYLIAGYKFAQLEEI